MGHVYSPEFRRLGDSNSLLKFRLGVSRYDFSAKKSTVDFLSVTAFGRTADRINDSFAKNNNFVCCFCDVKVSKYTSKTGVPVEHVEFIVNDFRAFQTRKNDAATIPGREDG
jgi:single-stranded DNA-binding protein